MELSELGLFPCLFPNYKIFSTKYRCSISLHLCQFSFCLFVCLLQLMPADPPAGSYVMWVLSITYVLRIIKNVAIQYLTIKIKLHCQRIICSPWTNRIVLFKLGYLFLWQLRIDRYAEEVATIEIGPAAFDGYLTCALPLFLTLRARRTYVLSIFYS